MNVWWEEWPERLKFEIAELEALGFAYSLNDYESAGQLEVQIKYALDRKEYVLVARFPSEYPYFPVHLWSEDLRLGRHQDPLDGHLCTLHDAGNTWSANEDTLASLIRDQLPRVIGAATEPESEYAAENEFHQGEPVTSYLQYEHGSFLAVGDFDLPETATSGAVKFMLSATTPVRGVLLEVADKSTGQPYLPDEWLLRAFRPNGARELNGRWKRISRDVDLHDPDAVFEAVYGRRTTTVTPSTLPRLALAVIEDEVGWREQGEGWLLVYLPPTRVKKGVSRPRPVFVRADRCGDSQLLARIPDLASLRDKHVVIIGLGMLGSPCALQLARAGVGKVTLVDPDTVDASTIVRWALGWHAVGRYKAIILSDYIRQSYPYCTTEPLPYQMGMPAATPVMAQLRKQLNSALENADLILDAAAEVTVSNYLAAQCRRMKKPHVVVTTTPGTLGGMMIRADWPNTGCWSCAKYYQYEGDLLVSSGRESEALLYSPNYLDVPGIQPAGCRVPTVVGNGFDSDWIATLAVRSAVSTLCQGHENGYPRTTYDGIVVNIRGDGGEFDAPVIKSFQLPRHPNCVCAK